jgi:transglutaminase-like putative cysteine protease
MIYKIVHRTTYRYKYPVSVGNHVACLKPRTLLHHQLARSELRIQPSPATRTERVDYFGNLLCFFTVQEAHRELVVESRSEVIMEANSTMWPQQVLSWEEAARLLPDDHSPAGLEAYQFGFESPRIRIRPEFASYALQSFTPGRPMPEALLDLTARIH